MKLDVLIVTQNAQGSRREPSRPGSTSARVAREPGQRCAILLIKCPAAARASTGVKSRRRWRKRDARTGPIFSRHWRTSAHSRDDTAARPGPGEVIPGAVATDGSGVAPGRAPGDDLIWSRTARAAESSCARLRSPPW